MTIRFIKSPFTRPAYIEVHTHKIVINLFFCSDPYRFCLSLTHELCHWILLLLLINYPSKIHYINDVICCWLWWYNVRDGNRETALLNARECYSNGGFLALKNE